MTHTPLPTGDDTVDRIRTQMLRDGVVQNYRLEDFAACFGVSLRTAWDLVARGEVEARKIGRRTVITAESAAAWRDRLPVVKPSKGPQ